MQINYYFIPAHSTLFFEKMVAKITSQTFFRMHQQNAPFGDKVRLCVGKDQAEVWDKYLWSYEQSSFLPHCIEDRYINANNKSDKNSASSLYLLDSAKEKYDKRFDNKFPYGGGPHISKEQLSPEEMSEYAAVLIAEYCNDDESMKPLPIIKTNVHTNFGCEADAQFARVPCASLLITPFVFNNQLLSRSALFTSFISFYRDVIQHINADGDSGMDNCLTRFIKDFFHYRNISIFYCYTDRVLPEIYQLMQSRQDEVVKNNVGNSVETNSPQDVNVSFNQDSCLNLQGANLIPTRISNLLDEYKEVISGAIQNVSSNDIQLHAIKQQSSLLFSLNAAMVVSLWVRHLQANLRCVDFDYPGANRIIPSITQKIHLQDLKLNWRTLIF